MFDKKKYEGILIYEDGHIVYGRNVDGRVLFRHNKISNGFGVFRSSRMTEDEMDFCIKMMGLFRPDSTEEDKINCMRFLRYEIDQNIYCS